MPLYALDGEVPVFAADALSNGSYRCIECRAPVKLRRGGGRHPHFYHFQKSSGCRLYSKSEDHLVLQLQLQKYLSLEKEALERPFLKIHRIADLIWEEKKIIFEIQCSSIEPEEVVKRVIDYRESGYDIVWLLDDRIFNRRFVRPAEKLLRSQTCYFFSFYRHGPSYFYDQLEIILSPKRVKKSFPYRVDLLKPRQKPLIEWPSFLPEQILERIANSVRYFRGDVLFRTIQSAERPTIALHINKWKKMEDELRKAHRPPPVLYLFFKKFVAWPYLKGLNWLLKNTIQ